MEMNRTFKKITHFKWSNIETNHEILWRICSVNKHL
jgi:hypothetical protein